MPPVLAIINSVLVMIKNDEKSARCCEESEGRCIVRMYPAVKMLKIGIVHETATLICTKQNIATLLVRIPSCLIYSFIVVYPS